MRGMEPLEATAAAAVSIVDELLLDFSSGDITHSPPPPPPPTDHHMPEAAAPSSSSEEHHLENSRSTAATASATIIHPSLLDGPAYPFPALIEEELEWLSNKDAFPTLGDGGFLTPVEPAPAPAPAPQSLFCRVPVRARSKTRRIRRRLLTVFCFPEEGCRRKRRCWHCQAEETPQWRAGPQGPKTLCNACGVRYKSGRLVPEYRPANSPSFSSHLHSNSHRKIMEMRRSNEKFPTPVAAKKKN